MTPTSGTSFGMVFVGLILAMPLVVVVPSILLARYKRSLHRLMRSPGTPRQPTENTDFQHTAVPSATRSGLPPPTLERARHRRIRCALIYVAGGVCCAAALTFGLLGESGVRSPSAFLFFFTVDLWPALLTLGIVFHWNRSAWFRSSAVYLSLLALLALLLHAAHPNFSSTQPLQAFLILNAPATLFYKAVTLKRIRQVGPTLLPFCLAIVLGPQILLHLGATDFSVALVIARAAIALRLTNISAIVFAVVLTMLFMAVCGFASAALLVVLYRARQIGDQSLLLDSLWLIVAGTQALVLLLRTGHETGSGAHWVLAAFPLYLVVVNLGLRLAQRHAPLSPTGANLLVLRAFALQQRAEAVFQPLTALWRYLGPVRLIGGPDLAGTTVQPSTFLEFVRGRLDRLFLQSPAQLQSRLREPDPIPDLDGLFRVSDFFCFEPVWRLAVCKLIERSDLILADFRGLGQGDLAGCEWEIRQIARSFGLAKCVFLLDPPPVDGPSDEIHLHTILAAVQRPLAGTLPPDSQPRIVHASRHTHRTLEDLLSALLPPAAARSIPPSP